MNLNYTETEYYNNYNNIGGLPHAKGASYDSLVQLETPAAPEVAKVRYR
jgi:hypothetical protein